MLKRVLIVFIPLAILVSLYAYLYEDPHEDEKSKLTVYTYSSFASGWGPGPELRRLFREETGHDVEFVDAGEAGVILQRILLEKSKTQADVVLGLDQYQLEDEKIFELFEPLPKLNLNIDEAAPLSKIQRGPFLAYNWAPMTFIYRLSDKNVLPKKLNDLVSPDFKQKIILFDPRTSSPGYIFFHWIVQRLGTVGTKDFFEMLKKNVYTVTPSWSAGYGLFKKKLSQYTFSYLTSPVYHWVEESDTDYQPLYLDEALPYHIEYMGTLKSSPNKEIAQKFREFLLTPQAQKIIMDKNYMLPVAAGVTKDSEFEKLKKVELFEFKKKIPREEVLKTWKSISW